MPLRRALDADTPLRHRTGMTTTFWITRSFISMANPQWSEGLQRQRALSSRTATSIASTMLSWFATPFQARSNAVPWSTETRRRSEEHTSELQSLAYLVCRLLLEKKKKKTSTHSDDLLNKIEETNDRV